MCACVHVCWLLSFGIWIVTSGSWLRTHPSNAARLLHGSTYNTPLPITTAHPVILHANAIIFIVCTPVCVSLSAAVHVLVYLWNSAHNHSDKTNTRPEANLHFSYPKQHTCTQRHTCICLTRAWQCDFLRQCICVWWVWCKCVRACIESKHNENIIYELTKIQLFNGWPLSRNRIALDVAGYWMYKQSTVLKCPIKIIAHLNYSKIFPL